MDPVLLRAIAVAVLLAAAVLAGRWWQRRDGRIRDAGDAALDADHLDALGLDLDDAHAGAVLLGSETCSPCETVKQVLGELEEERHGFRWVYADAADHLELAERHRVMRVPTLFVIERSGRIIGRTSGVPRTDELRQLLDGRGDLSGSLA
jgi:thiol-disulfide isomerase/thioredoxin